MAHLVNVRAAAMSRRVKAQRVRPVWRDPARSDAIPPVRRPSGSCSAISDRRAASRYMGTRCKQQQAMSQVETRTAVGSLPDAIEQTRLRFDTPQSPGELPDAGIEPDYAEAIASAILQSAAAWGHSRVARSELATFQDSMKSDMETFQDAGKSQSAVLLSDIDGRCPDIGSLRLDVQKLRSVIRSLRLDVRDLRSEAGRFRPEIASDLAKLETRLTNRMFRMAFGITGATASLIGLVQRTPVWRDDLMPVRASWLVGLAGQIANGMARRSRATRSVLCVLEAATRDVSTPGLGCKPVN